MKNIIIALMCLHLILFPLPTAKAGVIGEAIPQLVGITHAISGAQDLVDCRAGFLLASTVIFSVGGIAYIFGEMTGGREHNRISDKMKKDMEELENYMKNKAGGEAQRASLEKALENEENIQKFANKRKTWMTAIAAIYATATGFAAYEVIAGKLPLFLPIGAIALCSPGGVVTTATRAAMAGAIAGVYSLATGSSMLVTLASVIVAYQIGQGGAILTILNLPEGRLATFLAATAITVAVRASMAKKADKAGENADKIRAALAQMDADSGIGPKLVLPNGPGTTSGGVDGSAGGGAGGGGVNNPGGRNFAVTSLRFGDPKSPKTCIGNTNGVLDVSEKSCGNSIRLPQGKFDNTKLQVPSALSQGLTASQNFTQALADGDMARADVEAQRLESLSAKINAETDKLVGKANDALIAVGKKPVNVEAEVAKAIANAESFLSNPKNTSGVNLAATSSESSKLSSTSNDQTEQEVKSEKSLNGIGLPNGGVNSGSTIGTGVISEAVPAESLVASNTDSGSDGLNTKGEGGKEIADRDSNIWGIVSNRYILSFPKLMERKQISEK